MLCELQCSKEEGNWRGPKGEQVPLRGSERAFKSKLSALFREVHEELTSAVEHFQTQAAVKNGIAADQLVLIAIALNHEEAMVVSLIGLAGRARDRFALPDVPGYKKRIVQR